MKHLELKASKRQVVGKKVGALRRSGVIPLHLYGHGIESMPLQADSLALGKLLQKAGTSRLISLSIEGDAEPRNVLIKETQTDYLGDTVIHVDLYQVSMTEKIKVVVPVTLVGESPAVKGKLGTIMLNMHSVEVACLPGDIPSSIEVDLGVLVNLDDAIHVRDLKTKEGIALVSDPGDLIVKVGTVRVAKEEVKPVEAKVEEGAEGAAQAEGAEAAEKEGAKAGAEAGKAEATAAPEKGKKQ